MNGLQRFRSIRPVLFLVVMLLSVIPARANPISPPEKPVLALMTFVPITLAILLEAICVLLILRRSRHPRLFILWVLGMHLVTYPLFLALLWLLQGMPPALAMTLGEAAIVLIEGGLIYLMCRFLSPSLPPLMTPSVSRSLFASLVGNIASAATFPFIAAVCAKILFSAMSNPD